MATQALNKRGSMADDLIISVQELKDVFLFGLDLTDDNGDGFPDIMYEFYIRSAQEWVEKELGGIQICPRTIQDERHDFYAIDYSNYAFIKLFKYPVIEVTEVAIQHPMAATKLVFDPAWYRAQAVGSQINLVPTQGSISNLILGQSGGIGLPFMYGQLDYVPGLWSISYKAGFTRGNAPYLLREVIGMKAAMGPLNVAGDLIAGAGIASKSIGLDGLSQSLATTSSSTNAGYGARILIYNKEIASKMKGLKEYFGGLQMVVS